MFTAPKARMQYQSVKPERLHRLSWLLDNAIRVPGLNYRIGVVALLDLIPGIGDVAGTLLSGYIIAEAARAGAPRRTLTRMLANVGINTVVGAIPVVGPAFESWWKPNIRNMRLLDRHFENMGAAVPTDGRRGSFPFTR